MIAPARMTFTSYSHHPKTSMKKLPLLPAVLAITLSACGPAPSDQATPAAVPSPTAAPTQPAAPQVEVPPTKWIHAEPASLATCDTTAVTLRWDTRKDKPDMPTVKIYTGSGKLFAHAGASGSVETGKWVKPGSSFILKSGNDDSELERLVIGGPVCSQ